MRAAAGGGADPARLLPKSMRQQMQESAAAAAAEKQLQEEVVVSPACLVWCRPGQLSSTFRMAAAFEVHEVQSGVWVRVCYKQLACKTLCSVPGIVQLCHHLLS
jgi:hypothetical protein